nr:hypothetical protein [Cupriavidus necator]
MGARRTRRWRTRYPSTSPATFGQPGVFATDAARCMLRHTTTTDRTAPDNRPGIPRGKRSRDGGWQFSGWAIRPASSRHHSRRRRRSAQVRSGPAL